MKKRCEGCKRLITEVHDADTVYLCTLAQHPPGDHGAFIGLTDRTPDWCPVKQARKTLTVVNQKFVKEVLGVKL